MKKTPEVLNRIVDKVLSYRAKAKTEQAKKRQDKKRSLKKAG